MLGLFLGAPTMAIVGTLGQTLDLVRRRIDTAGLMGEGTCGQR
jgi:hypothetical protein